MELKVIRSVLSANATLGKLYLDNHFFGYTLEDVERGLNGNCLKKIKNETAIDYGKYEVILSFSNRFQKYLPLLLNVPCFEGIRMHGGNTDKDTEGCILVGAESNMQDRIWNCPGKVRELVAALKAVERKEKIWIELVKG